MRRLLFEVDGCTDAGVAEKINQDAFLFRVAEADDAPVALLAVADGVGGLTAGEKASAIAIACVRLWWENAFHEAYNDPQGIYTSLLRCFETANQQILKTAQEEGVRMGTVLSVLLLHHNQFEVMHVGDSRIYRLSAAKRLSCLTQDHSCIVNKEVGGRMVAKQVLTDCIGYRADFKHWHTVGPVKRDETYLVCSDGIYKTMPDEILCKQLSEGTSAEGLCHTLVDVAKSNGEKDNITGVVARIG